MVACNTIVQLLMKIYKEESLKYVGMMIVNGIIPQF